MSLILYALLYALLGFVLGFAGVTVVDKPLEFIAILAIVLLIDAVGRNR